MTAKLLTAALTAALIANAATAADPWTRESVERYRRSVGGPAKVPLGTIRVVNDYDHQETLALYHPDEPKAGKDFGHWPVPGRTRTGGLSGWDGKEMRVGGDWGVQVIFGNDTRSEVVMLRDVAQWKDGGWVVKLSDIQAGRRK